MNFGLTEEQQMLCFNPPQTVRKFSLFHHGEILELIKTTPLDGIVVVSKTKTKIRRDWKWHILIGCIKLATLRSRLKNGSAWISS
jgi:hypothetical protein